MRTAVLLALLAAAAAPSTSRAAGVLVASTPAAAAPSAGAKPGAERAGPAIHVSYAPALAEARARGVPLLVDVWAPW